MDPAERERVEEYRREVQEIIEEERLKHAVDPEGPQNDPGMEWDPDFLAGCLRDNEKGDGRVLLELYRDRFVYDQGADAWYEWSGRFWVKDRLREVQHAVEEVARVYGGLEERLHWLEAQETRKKTGQAGARAKEYGKLADKVRARIFDLQTKKRVLNVAYLSAIGRESFIITGDQWDLDPWLLGCANGVLDLRTGLLREGQREDWIRTVCPAEFRGLDESAPIWERFLHEIFDGDEELVFYLQRVLGYAITGLSTQHEFYILWGTGRNGKGTLLNTLQEVLGPLAGEVETELLLSQRYPRPSGGPRSDLMALRGKRVIWASEAEEERRFDVSRVKWLVGGDRLVGRDPYGREQVTWLPTHTLFLLTNHCPHAQANDYAFWQRVRRVPFTLSFVDAPRAQNERKRDPYLVEKLKQEAPGILAWLVRGTLEWQKVGLLPPRSVLAATEGYRDSEDIVGQFIRECCVVNREAQVKAGDLYRAYLSWCVENGIKELSNTRFGREIKSLFGWMKTRCVVYLGIGLPALESEPGD